MSKTTSSDMAEVAEGAPVTTAPMPWGVRDDVMLRVLEVLLRLPDGFWADHVSIELLAAKAYQITDAIRWARRQDVSAGCHAPGCPCLQYHPPAESTS